MTTGYPERIRAVARRVNRHFQGVSATLVKKVSGAGDVTFTVQDCAKLSAAEFYARFGVTPAGDLLVSVPRDTAAWDVTQQTPAEGWRVTIDGEVGTVRKVHTKVPVWLLECSQS